MKYSVLFLLLVSILSACSAAPSETQIQTAIAQAEDVAIVALSKPTETEIPTGTNTTAPTSTPTETTTPTITPTPTETLTPTITFTPTITNTPTETPVPTATLPAGFACVPTDTERTVAKVVGITDGDTIKVEIDGLVYKVRYIGMDTPESTTTVEYFGSQATNKNIELVKGQTVTLVKDVSETDKYDRLLRYVFAGNIFVNYELVRQGFANPATYPPDVACQDLFATAEREARDSELGFWAPTATPKPYVPPVVVPVVPVQPPSEGGGNNPAPTQPPQQSNCDPSYPSVCIPPPPPDLDCGDISYRNFPVTGSDPHRFDGDHDGYGCEG